MSFYTGLCSYEDEAPANNLNCSSVNNVGGTTSALENNSLVYPYVTNKWVFFYLGDVLFFYIFNQHTMSYVCVMLFFFGVAAAWLKVSRPSLV